MDETALRATWDELRTINDLVANGESLLDQPDPRRITIGLYPTRGAPIKTLGDYLRIERDLLGPARQRAHQRGFWQGIAAGIALALLVWLAYVAPLTVH